ncbi:cytochrome b [Tropicimonas sp. S265A]|uniref:cytochrome b n=1 Tax=Tropicimonas sp. S265A TaxID=3415134 RepID=UPI003C7D7D0A
MTVSTSTYRTPARWLHWSMAALILAMIPAGVIMIQEGLNRPLQNTLFIFHKNVGVLLLLMVALRLLYRWRNPPPPEPAGLPGWQTKIAGMTHMLLYGLLVLMPVAGYTRVKAGGFPVETLDALGVPSLVPRSDALAAFAKAVHYYGSWAIAILVAMHIGAALFHRFVKKDAVFARMWPGAST